MNLREGSFEALLHRPTLARRGQADTDTIAVTMEWRVKVDGWWSEVQGGDVFII